MRIENKEAMGEMMRNRRRALGFTLEQMAQAVGVSPITIMRLELGRVGYIHEKTAKALEVPAKVINRMITTTVPTAVMRDGTEKPLSAVKSVPQHMLESGDPGVISPAEATRKALEWHSTAAKQTHTFVRQARKPRAQRIPKPAPLSLRKRVFLWLAGVKQN